MAQREIRYPPDIILSICAHIYSAALPAPSPSLDPLVVLETDYPPPTGLPSTIPPGNWPEPVARHTLASLCLVDRAWYTGAKPWLWRRLEVRLPRSWLGIVEQVAWDFYDPPTVLQAALAVEESIKAAADAALASGSVICSPETKKVTAMQLEELIMENLSGPDSPIPLELLSPPASRDPSPRRLRAKSKSPSRWKIIRTINDAVQKVMQHEEPGVYVPAPHDPRPGRHVRHLDFNHFRTIGMRRSVKEGVNSRFVTGPRLEAVLKEMPNLAAFGATEYMDGALTLPVLKELFLRGPPSRGRARTSRGRASPVFDPNDSEEDDRERRRDCKVLEAVDLTGCVSAVFVNALTDFVTELLLPSNSGSGSSGSSSEDEDPPPRRCFRRPRARDEPLLFPGLARLSLRGVKSIASNFLTPFVLSFPSLTHLDISCTRATPALLQDLGKSSNIRLRSLSMGQCVFLTGASIRDFLVRSQVTHTLRELSLYGDALNSSPLSTYDLRDILMLAPCFGNGELVYLDLSSAPLTRPLLLDSCPPQPRLRSLGLSYIPDLPLATVAEFLRDKTPCVEILTLIGTSPELDHGPRAGPAAPRSSACQASIALHTQLIGPLCTSPFASFSLYSGAHPPALQPPPSSMRVIEFSIPFLTSLGAGAGTWRIVRSKGGRGWYVDSASGWVASGALGAEFRRNLEKDHPYRRELDRLADANGNISSGVGWHARKMEILHGNGMLGREDGLYGAVSFAYQG